MVIVKVKFEDWNRELHEVEVTSDMCPALKQTDAEEDLMLLAVQYIKRRYTEWYSIYSAEIIAC